MYSKVRIADVILDNVIYALDSTAISTSIKLATWALGKYSKGAVKMHTQLDLRGSIPVNIHITDGKWHDNNMWAFINIEAGAIYTADKAYIDLEQMWRMNIAGTFFVMRPKDNIRYEVVGEQTDDRLTSSVRADFIIRLTGVKSKKLYPAELRIVKAFDDESGELVTFVTNNFRFSPLDIANTYRHRWDIDVFFKWIKQNITIKQLWGYSENAVKTHLWVAISAYLVLAKIKAEYNSLYSITEIATLIRVSAFEKTDLKALLTKAIETISQNQKFKELPLFESI